MLAGSLAVAIGVYAVGVTRLWRSAGYGRGVRPFEALAFSGGCVALLIALSPPLDEWSERWLAAHMVQHELLMVVAAPLIAVTAILTFSSCKTVIVEPAKPTVRTTTTEETTVRHPHGGVTTETEVRRY